MIVEETACCSASVSLPIAVTADSEAEATEGGKPIRDQVVDVDRFASYW